MANSKISDLKNLPADNVATNDLLVIVDRDSTLSSPSGETKNVTVTEFASASYAAAPNKTFTSLNDAPDALQDHFFLQVQGGALSLVEPLNELTVTQSNDLRVGQAVQYVSNSFFDGFTTASCDSIQNSDVVGIIVNRTPNTITVASNGYVDLIDGNINLTKGATYYLAATTQSVNGNLVEVDPSLSNTDYVSKPIMVAIESQSAVLINQYGIPNATTSTRGFLPQLSGDKNQVLLGTGEWGIGGSVQETINQVGHGFAVGQAVRIDSSGNYVKASANTNADAEAVGIIKEVSGSNQFTVAYGGKVELSGTPPYGDLVPGELYFLSTTNGNLTVTDPGSNPLYVSKPMFVAVETGSCIITNYRGAKTASGSSSGSIIISGSGAGNVEDEVIQSNTFSPGNIVRIDNTGTYVTASADTSTNSEAVGIIKSADSSSFTVVFAGKFELDSNPVGLGAMTPGTVYFLESSSGYLTTVDPNQTDSSKISKPVVVGIDSTTGVYVPYRGISGAGGGAGGSSKTINETNSFQPGNIVRINGSGDFVNASADTITNAEAVGIVTSANSSSYTVAFSGFFELDSNPVGLGAMNFGQVYFLESSSGYLTPNDPSIDNTDYVSKPCVVAQNNKSGIYLPYRGLRNSGSADFVDSSSYAVTSSYALNSPSFTYYTSSLIFVNNSAILSGSHQVDMTPLIPSTAKSIFVTARGYDRTLTGGTQFQLDNIIVGTEEYGQQNLGGTDVVNNGLTIAHQTGPDATAPSLEFETSLILDVTKSTSLTASVFYDNPDNYGTIFNIRMIGYWE